MSILGHDIDGRPLRVGDEVVVVGAFHREHQNLIAVIIGEAPKGELGDVCVDVWDGHFDAWSTAFGRQLRKLTDDHRPADESFTEMMDKFKGVRV